MTQFFSDGFESGNFNAWTSLTGSPAVTNSVKHTGNCSCAFSIAGGAVFYLVKSHSSSTHVHVRFYVRFDQLPPPNSALMLARLDFDGQVPLAGVFNDNGVIHWYLHNGGRFDASSGPAACQWYCLELKGAVGDECALWVNGVKEVTTEGPTGVSAVVALGSWYYWGSPDGVSMYFDDVVVADGYVGPLALCVSVDDSLRFSDECLLVSRVLLVVDGAVLVEVVDRFDVHRTRLFLVLGDLAIQLTGD